MKYGWLLIAVLTAQAVLPIGGAACACQAGPQHSSHACDCGCQPDEDGRCCCFEAGRQSEQPANATFSNFDQTTARVFVLSSAEPILGTGGGEAVAVETAIPTHEYLVCLTRAQRAPPA